MMKAMTRQQLAAYAGVDARTLRNWIKPYQEQLWRIGMPKGKGALPPNVACDVPMGAHPAALAACVANKKGRTRVLLSCFALFLSSNYLAFEEVEEEGPVGTCFVTSMMLTIGEASVHQAIVHTWEEVGAHSFIAEQFIDG